MTTTIDGRAEAPAILRRHADDALGAYDHACHTAKLVDVPRTQGLRMVENRKQRLEIARAALAWMESLP